MSVCAALSLEKDKGIAIGRQRILLLEEVARCGSIAAAARSLGLSYKAAWDGIEATQNLMSQPLLCKNAGGRRGGGAQLTPEGLKFIEVFHHLEAGLATMLRDAERDLTEAGLSSSGFIHGFMMRNSARNVFVGEVEHIHADAVSASLTIRITPEVKLCALITTKSVEVLGLTVGRSIAALIKASFVSVARQHRPSAAANVICGQLRSAALGGKTAELIIDMGNDKTLVATSSKAAYLRQKWQLGEEVSALIKPDRIIIAAY